MYSALIANALCISLCRCARSLNDAAGVSYIIMAHEYLSADVVSVSQPAPSLYAL